MLGGFRVKVYVAAAALVMVMPAVARAQTADSPGDPLTRGRTEIGVGVGFGNAMDIWGGLPDSEFLTLGVDIGYVLTGPIFAGPCRGNLLISGEFYPAIAFHENVGTTYALSTALIFRYHFTPGARVRPFISAGAGVVLSDKPIPRNISRTNFTPQGGGGLTVAIRRNSLLSFEYRIHHMSDGILTTYNPGVNSNVFQVGFSWIH